MGTTYRKKRRHLRRTTSAVSQNGAAIAHPLTLMLGGDDAETERSKHMAQAGESAALSGATAAVLVHEVANPLGGISITLEYIKKALERGDLDIFSLIATLEDTLLEIDRLRSLLKEFRGIGWPPNMDFQEIDLEKITKEVLSCQYAAYRKLGITVKVEFDNPLPPVMAHADKIKQVVLNLCKNAVDAMPDGGFLTVKGSRFAPMVILEISDTGAGIPEGLDVFELFSTTTRDGSGIGLPLVRQIVSAHRGTINYTSVPGPNPRTTFKVSLPAAG